MKIKFLKYKPSGTELNNYFDKESENVLADTLELTQLPIDSFPIFNDEVSDREDFFQFKASDFDIFISYLQKDKSAQGKSIIEFFNELENSKMLCVFELGQVCRAGFVDYSAIEKDYNYNENRGIRLTIYGALKELSEYLKTKSLTQYEFPYTLDEILHRLFIGVAKISNVVNKLNYTAKIRFEPILSLPLYNDIRKHTSISNVNRWTFFISLAKELGWAFSLTVSYDLKWYLNIFWRSEITDEATIKIIDWKEGYEILQKEWLFFENRYYSITTPDNYSINMSDGLLMKKDWARVTDNNQQNTYNNAMNIYPRFVTYNKTPTEILDNYIIYRWSGNYNDYLAIFNRDDNVLETGTDMHDFNLGREGYIYDELCKLYSGSCKVSRMFVKNWQRLSSPLGHYYKDEGSIGLQMPLITEYQFLLSGMKDTVKLKIVYNDNYNIQLYRRFSLSGRTFWINRITNLNLLERTCEIEAIEL